MTALVQPISSTQQESQPLSKTEQLMKDIRQTPLFRQLIPQEAGVGWPIPLRKGGKVYLTLPFFGFAPTAQKGFTKLFPPFATITLDWSNQVPVEYVNLRFRNPAPELNWEGEVGTFPHPAVSQMTFGQYQQRRRNLLEMYDQMFDMLSQNSPFSEEWCEQFSQLLRLLVEPSLEPYYRALGGKFFDRFLAK